MSAGPVKAEDVGAALDAAVLNMAQEPSPEQAEQVAAARAAAKAIIESGALGRGCEFLVNLSGHAVPGHAPTDGWSTDSISINVSQAQVKPGAANPAGAATTVDRG